MFRTDVSTNTNVDPTPATPGTPGFFQNGNPGANIPATIVDADWLNTVQEELMAVILAAGLTPSKTNRGQLLQALGILGFKLAPVGTFNLYVSPTGSDFNDGLTSGTPFLTIAHAYGVLLASYDLSSASTTIINLAHGTYTAGLAAVQLPAGEVSVEILGDPASPASVIVSVTNNNCFSAFGQANLSISGVTLSATGSLTNGFALVARNGGFITVGPDVIFGACDSGHTDALFSGLISFSSNYTISGSTFAHLSAHDHGSIFQFTGIVATLTGTPNFTNAFAKADALGNINATGTTFSGAATGARYNSEHNSIIHSGGGGANYFPGNSAGTAVTGLYL